MVEKSPSILKEDVHKDDVESLTEKLQALGCVVSAI
jgi:ribosomal protein L7/L12